MSVEDVGLAQYLVVCDKKNRKLYLRVKTELLGQMSLKVRELGLKFWNDGIKCMYNVYLHVHACIHNVCTCIIN